MQPQKPEPKRFYTMTVKEADGNAPKNVLVRVYDQPDGMNPHTGKEHPASFIVSAGFPCENSANAWLKEHYPNATKKE